MKPPKKKKQTVKVVSQLPDHAEKADELGKSYSEYRETAKQASASQKKLTKPIQALAEKHGVPHKKSRIVKGEKFVVGYYTRTPAKINTDMAKQLLPKTSYDKCLTTFFDSDKLAVLVENGEVKQGVFRKLLIFEKPVKYTIVKTKEEFEKDAGKDEEASHEKDDDKPF
jgi:hypothetical protein